ncbi:density-regulated protein-like [Oscarella lobularis]|uniref:density-regulated protein-like n=1 Tax=Oscarella lobularis TaxID=121494 RepID=UPI003313E840
MAEALSVLYCGVCTMPTEYCEYGPDPAKCKTWLQQNHPDLVQDDNEDDAGGAVKKKQTRGGKALRKAEKKREVEKKIVISKVTRNKRKYVTVVVGLGTYGINLKKTSKLFATHFSCGSSVTGEDEIVIQGDVCGDIVDYLLERFPEIDEDTIIEKGDAK